MQTLEELKSGKLLGTKRLKLSCELAAFPIEIYELADTLEVLDLSDNLLSQLPDDFGRLKNLKIVFFSNNNFQTYPEELAQCPLLEMVGFKANHISYISPLAFTSQLRWLILTDNKLQEIPSSIGNCVRLQKCMLAGNFLKTLPVEMAHCTNLELLRISANYIEELPTWLLSMPKLCWLAMAGNSFIKKQTENLSINAFNWNDLKIETQIGEGASGCIYKANWYVTNVSKSVAVKVFKGEVTSDGFPADELKATIAAGLHPNMVKLLGKLQQHPNGQEGLVFDLIPSNFTNLGMPPDFVSCTRDNFAEGTRFTVKALWSIAHGIASVCSTLHSEGIMHGDLYAHNMLINENYEVLLTDFGAAVCYDINSETAIWLQRLEVRAFGCLLEDLLQLILPTPSELAVIHSFEKLLKDCVQQNVSQRPTFKTIEATINKFRQPSVS